MGVPAPVVMAIDPGRRKAGVAVVERGGQVLYRAVLTVQELESQLPELCARFRPRAVVVGGGTGWRVVQPLLRPIAAEVPVHVVDESYTSEQARRRYLRENPPRGWRRLLPAWLRTPDQPYDDYVAIILAERYWQQEERHEQGTGGDGVAL